MTNFYAQFGTFMHTILQRYFSGELRRYELTSYYLSNFKLEVTLKPQHASTYDKYFKQGLEYLVGFTWGNSKILGVEQEVSFSILDNTAKGFIDLLEWDDGLIITDHKSADIKPRSTRKKPTLGDIRLDEMFRQLYLYSLAVYEQYGEYPKELRFNTFRNNIFVSEPFKKQKLEAAVSWANDKIEEITTNDDWQPDLDFFRCNYICDMRHQCEWTDCL